MNFLEVYAKNKEVIPGIPGVTLNAPVIPRTAKGDIGLELELEAANSLPSRDMLSEHRGRKSRATWVTHADGSLRGNAIEYVLSNPCFVDEVDTLVNGVYKTMEEHGTRLRLSNRCSTHVHLNVGGLKINQLTSIIMLWGAFESALINWCGTARKTNHFCLSFEDSNQVVSAWNNYLMTGRRDFNDGMKYSALNIRPLTGIGSFEFRCMRADLEPQNIIDWVKLVFALKEEACTTFADPSRIPDAFSEATGTELFMHIGAKAGLQDTFLSTVVGSCHEKPFDLLCLEGVRRVQRLSSAVPWTLMMPEIEKKFIPDPFESPKATKYFIGGEFPTWEGEARDPFGGHLEMEAPRARTGRAAPGTARLEIRPGDIATPRWADVEAVAAPQRERPPEAPTLEQRARMFEIARQPRPRTNRYRAHDTVISSETTRAYRGLFPRIRGFETTWSVPFALTEENLIEMATERFPDEIDAEYNVRMLYICDLGYILPETYTTVTGRAYE